MWEEIRGFTSPEEYKRFLAYLDDQVKACLTCEVPYDAAQGTIKTTGERWFKNLRTGEIWKLLIPDPGYFAGAWVRLRQ